MKMKTKSILLIILTFGIYYLVVKNKSKNHISATSLSHSTKINFKISELINTLGGKNNIVSVSSSLSSVSINLKSSIKLSSADIKKFHIHGVSYGYNKLTIIFGDNSLTIAKELNNGIHN
jgi:phosphotransferase system IIB component